MGCFQAVYKSRGKFERCSHRRVAAQSKETAATTMGHSKTSGMSKLSPLKQATLRKTALQAMVIMEEKNIAHLLEEQSKV